MLMFLFFYLCAASSCNTYTKTFTGIDGAGKRLADEVSIQIYTKTCSKISAPFISNVTCSFLQNDLVLHCHEQVMQVVQKTDSLKKISFLAHSLGGLFARYAVAVLYTPRGLSGGKPDDPASSTVANSQTACSSRRGMIAGLEPINFITLATPHLGVRGRKQVCP